jgi:hypothetical protein
MKNKNRSTIRSLAAGIGTLMLAHASLNAGTFTNNFNSLQFDPNDPAGPSNSFLAPDGTSWVGNLTGGIAAGYDLRTGGVSNSGVLKLVNAVGSQNSTFIVDNFDGGNPFAGFDLTFSLLLGGGNGADGFSFYVGDFTDGNYGEEGPGVGQIHGLTVSIDVYNNGGTVAEAPAIDLKWDGVVIAHRPGTPAIGALPVNLQSGTAFWPVKLHADPDGTVDLSVNNVVVFAGVPLFRAITEPTYSSAMRFGFSARTGGSTINAFIDDLKITTAEADATAGQPFLTSMVPVLPIDQPYSALGGVSWVIHDSTNKVDPATVKVLYNTTTVTPVIARTKSSPDLTDPDQTTISYFGVNNILPAGAATATVSYFTTGTPAVSNLFVNTFTIVGATSIPAAWAVTGVDTNKPGFKARMYQMDRWRSPGDQNITPVGERQLAYGFIDPLTHLPYPDVSTQDYSLLDTNGYFNIEGVLNFEQSGGNAGQISGATDPIRTESLFPGIPGNSTLDASMGNFAMEFEGFLYLKAGGHRLGLFADDRFRFSFGPSFGAVGTAPQAASTGANADTVFDIVIPSDGYYPFRCSYWEGGGGANYEFYWVEPGTNKKILVNDPELTQSPRAYREATNSRPWIQRVLPVENWVGAFPNEDVTATIIDGAIPVDGNSISMQINNVNQTITKNKVGGITTIKRPGSDTNLLPSGLNTVKIIFSYTDGGASVSQTNQYAFSVAPYYNVIPAANKVSLSDINTADTGFHARYTQMDRSKNAPNDQAGQGRISGGGDANRMPNPEIQLWAGELNPTNGLPYPNIADPGANGNFTADFDLVNFNISFTAPTATAPGAYASGNTGFFQSGAPAAPLPGGAKTELPMPGTPSPTYTEGNGVAAGNINPSNGGLDNYVMEMTTYLDLKKGVHVFGFNSDDGFVCTSAPNPNDTLGTLLGFFTGGRGNANQAINTGNFVPTGGNPPTIQPGVLSGSSLFSVIVPEDGIYPFRVLYWNGGGGINAEFFSVDQENGTYVLINDRDATYADGTTPVTNTVPAYRTYTGPARPWTEFSVSPTPWDNRQQQAGPGPLKMVGRTINNIQSTDIYNFADELPVNTATKNTAPWADIPIGGIIANGAPGGTADASIKLLLDGVEVPATKTVQNTSELKVAYQPNPPLASGSKHTASLVYAGTTNSWSFAVQPYTTLSATNKATLAADTTAVGFSAKIAQSSAARPGANSGNAAASAEAQIAGNPANTAVAGPEADGRYIVPGIINFNNNMNTGGNGVGLGNFQKNIYGSGWPFPDYTDAPWFGLGGAATAASAINFSVEFFAYLQFPAAGYYRFGGNADDGFLATVGTPGVTNGPVLFTQDRGGGAADIPFSFMIPEAGLYPIRAVYYQGTGGAAFELFSYDQSGNKIPINDPNNPASIKAFYKLQSTSAPHLTSSLSGNTLTISWTGGGELESATDVTGPWTGTGNSTGTATVTIPPGAGTKFYRVRL